MRTLSDMTLQELWELFPVTLVEHDPSWERQARDEMELLKGLLAVYNPVMHHIGSTAVPGIKAKPIVDILVEVPDFDRRCMIRSDMETSGYICMAESDAKMSFNKGYTPEGYADKVFHVHFRHAGDRDEVLFRDYLLGHPEAAEEYERLKLSLLPRFRNDRDGYTEAKTEFVRGILAKAVRS